MKNIVKIIMVLLIATLYSCGENVDPDPNYDIRKVKIDSTGTIK